MREKLIELLKEDTCPGLSYEDCAYCKYDGEHDCFYKSQADHLIASGVVISKMETTTKWIPVTERLPNWKDGKVLVFTKYGFSICERTVNNRWQGQHANWITHWAYLPQPPEGE